MISSHMHSRAYQGGQHRVSMAGDCDCVFWPPDEDTPDSNLPTLYALELTPLCNSRCPGCSNVFLDQTQTRAPSYRHQVPMSCDQWDSLLDIIAPYAHHLNVTGGEATLHPQFASVIAAIEHRHICFTVFTNGRWTDPDAIIDVLQHTAHCTGLLISLHGATAEAHEAFTGIAGSFNETVQTIRQATAAGLRVSTNTVLTRQNSAQIAEIIQVAQALGAEQTVFNRYIGQSIAHLALGPCDLKHALRQIQQDGTSHGRTRGGTCVPHCFAPALNRGPCLAGELFCTIDPWGNVRPCNHAPQIAGNLFREPLEQIWQSPVMEAWRHMVPQECTTCHDVAQCRGGCRADAVLNGLDHDSLMPWKGLAPHAARSDFVDHWGIPMVYQGG